LPEIGEYGRASTTVANAYVQPIMSRYLERLERVFGEDGLPRAAPDHDEQRWHDAGRALARTGGAAIESGRRPASTRPWRTDANSDDPI
jgi:hypothetical protein